MNKPLTASRAAKLSGFKSIKHLASLAGVSRHTLHLWFAHDRELFDATLKNNKVKICQES
jgi:hypothetical protein